MVHPQFRMRSFTVVARRARPQEALVLGVVLGEAQQCPRRHSEMRMMMFRRVASLAAGALALAACSSMDSLNEAVPLHSGSEVVTDPARGVSASATPVSALGFEIETHARTDLRNYDQFSFMAATTRGLAPDAAARADERIRGVVDAAMNDALTADDGACGR